MTDLSQLGRLILVIGVVLVLLGALLMLVGRVPFLGHLPGDFTIRRGGVAIYAPIVTMIVLSLLLTIVLNVIARR